MVRVRWIVIASLALAACGSSSNEPVTDAGADADGARDVASDAAATADATDAGYGNPDGPCVPGVPRCHGDFGYQMCEQGGTWSESHSCAGYSTNGTTSYCAEIPMEGGGEWATCVDPACWYWLGRGALGGATAVGVCERDGTMQACGAGGTLVPATCDGVCTRVTTLDGRAVGYCAPACADGARECLGGPFYRTCVKGRWSEADACDGACNPVATGRVPDIRCGGACEAGTSRCRADLLAVEVCKPDGTWVEDRGCLRGRCRPAGPQAECETQCVPGEHQCLFDGAGSERVCGEQGLWMAETPCASVTTTCRLSGDVSLGCVECVGARPGGGNAFGVADQRCGASGGVQTCSADGHWLDAVSCREGARCVPMAHDVSSLAACQPL
ncbi:MAG TPA: hypothetical protein VHK47_22775 [Polyangia bacterium]|jgi:hypothetical protein|nr:hypothetical protein [Polyangia bacterium]